MSVYAGIICAVVYWVILMVDQNLLSWQCLVRPIVVSPIVGLLLGDLSTGIIMGAQLEALYMGISAIGGAVPSDALSGSIIAVAYAILVGGEGAMQVGLSLAMTIGTVMASLNSIVMALGSTLAPYWERLAAECKPMKFKIQTLAVAGLTAGVSAIVVFFGVAFGVDGLSSALAACPAWVLTGFGAAGSMMTAVGFGILLAMIWDPTICVFYFVGFICAMSLGLSSLGIAVLGAAIALTLFFVQKDIIEAKKAGTPAAASGPANSEEDFF